MTHFTQPSAIALSIVLALLELLFYISLGDALSRLLTGTRLYRRLPELALWLGIATYALLGTLLLPAGLPVQYLPMLTAALLLLRINRPQATDPDTFHTYQDFRRSPWGKAALLLAVTFALAVVAFRIPWLGLQQQGGEVAWGTRIYDDLRTFSNPISLAAHGWPLRSPFAVETRLAYPPGSFLLTAAAIAWLPQSPVAIITADSFVIAFAFALAILAAAGSLATRSSAFLAIAAALLSLSIDLNRLPIPRDTAWYRQLYGYTLARGMDRTPAWSTYRALFWIPNHAEALAAILLLALIYWQWPRARRLCYPLAAFAASVSLDITVMGGLFAFFTGLRRPDRLPIWRIAACGAAFLIAVNWPSLSSAVDAPVAASFRFIEKPWWNLGAMLSTHGLLLLLTAIFFLTRPAFSPLLTAVLVPLTLSFVFRWESIWYWRSAFALHTLLALAALSLLQNRVWAKALLTLALTAGLSHFTFEAADELRNVPRVSPAAASLHTFLRDLPLPLRTVEWRDSEAVLTPTVNLLRTGNRAGDPPFDRLLPIVGYRRYQQEFRSLARGLAANDVIVYRRDRPQLDTLLRDCGAETRFSNRAAIVYAITPACRTWLASHPVDATLAQALAARPQLRAAAQQAGGPLHLDDATLQRYLTEIPDDGLLRQRADAFWNKSQFAEAARFLAPIVAQRPSAGGHYCLAFSYQLAATDRAKAIEHYTQALDFGFSEFWVRYGRGSTYLSLGDRARARADLERAAQLEPTHSGVQQYLKELK